MNFLLSVLLPVSAFAATPPPTPFPVFLKLGFSSVLEFEDAPTKVVLGDAQGFQVEKLDRSLVLKSLLPYATSNLFVYFKTESPRLFVLTATEDADPTYYRKFESEIPQKAVPSLKPAQTSYPKGGRLAKAEFDRKKDYLTVELTLAAGAEASINPNWELVRLSNGKYSAAPTKLWSERREIQKDSTVKVRLVFTKPNVSRSLDGFSVIVPIHGDASAIRIPLGGRR